MDKFNDIEPIIENSFSNIIVFTAILAAILAVVALTSVFKYFKPKKKANPFDSLDFSKANKELIYKFTIIAKSHKKLSNLESLLEELEKYKYKKDTKKIDSQIVKKMQEYAKSYGESL